MGYFHAIFDGDYNSSNSFNRYFFKEIFAGEDEIQRFKSGEYKRDLPGYKADKILELGENIF